MSLFDARIQRYHRELNESVIPFWVKNCVDRDDGGYFTCLDRDGSVYDTEKYMWMQWRIVYMFATLYTSEFKRPEFLEIAQHGYAFLSKHGKDENGNYYFALNKKGVPSIAPYNIYSDCFAAMGCAALFKATHDPAHKRDAEAAMNNYIKRMDNPKGRWEKSLAGRPARLSLGHYMILANLGWVLNDCFNSDQYAKEIDSAARTVLDKFWNEDRRILFENINKDGSFDLDTCDGRHLNPGHGLESMWFIMQHAEKTKNTAMIEKSARITSKLLEFGWDKEHGGIFYFMDALNKPHMELQHDMKLWWVHNEALLAILYAYRLTKGKEFLTWFEKVDDWTWSKFPDAKHGEWFAYLNRRGEPTHMLKGGKWKTFFHLPRFLLLGIQQMRAC
jgi:N-acylglucosamine 2-epimerase